MVYKLSAKSINELTGVHDDLVKVVKLAITLSKVDFRVEDGLRTKEEQQKLIAKGVSKTMNSRHLTGHAVDLVALQDGKVSWHWSEYFKIADAMREAANSLEVPLEWGGAWDRVLTDTKGSTTDLSSDYVARMKSNGKKKVFIDGPHFQLPRKQYP